MPLVQRKATLPPKHLAEVIRGWFGTVNAAMDLKVHPWTSSEHQVGRKVLVSDRRPEVLAGLRDAYASKGWVVYAVRAGKASGVEYYLEFWPA